MDAFPDAVDFHVLVKENSCPKPTPCRAWSSLPKRRAGPLFGDAEAFKKLPPDARIALVARAKQFKSNLSMLTNDELNAIITTERARNSHEDAEWEQAYVQFLFKHMDTEAKIMQRAAKRQRAASSKASRRRWRRRPERSRAQARRATTPLRPSSFHHSKQLSTAKSRTLGQGSTCSRTWRRSTTSSSRNCAMTTLPRSTESGPLLYCTPHPRRVKK